MSKCKYCGSNPKDLGIKSFEGDICPSCQKSREGINGVVLRNSASVDLTKISPFAKEGDYLEVTEWANEEGFDVEIYSPNKIDGPVQRFSLTYDEYEAMANLIYLFDGFKPVFYVDNPNE